MRKFVIVGLLATMLVIGGCAKEVEASGWDCDSFVGQILNKCVSHPSPDKELMPIGVGLDLVLLESDIEGISYAITTEYRYDVRNSESTLFGVITLKLQDIINKIKGE